MSENSVKCENLRYEYSEINSNFRHYSSLRFAVFALYFPTIVGIASVAFEVIKSDNHNLGFNLPNCAKLCGFLVTCIYFLFEYLIEKRLVNLSDMGLEIEKHLKYAKIHTKKPPRIIRAFYATTIMYLALIAFWIYVIFLIF